MCIHLRLEDPGTDGAVLAVHVGLPHLVDGLLGPEPQHLVGGHLHVGLALLRNLPLLVHHSQGIPHSPFTLGPISFVTSISE